MKLNGKEYELPEVISFGYLKKANDMLKNYGTNFMQVMAAVEGGDIFSCIAEVVAVIAGCNVKQATDAIDKHVDNGGSYDEIFNGALEAVEVLMQSSVMEGFIKAVSNLQDRRKAQTAKETKAAK